MKRSLLQFVLACALPMVMEASRWAPVGGFNNEYQEYLDRQSVKRSGNKVTLWTRRDFVRQQRTVWTEVEVDCSSKRDTVLAYVQDDAGTVSHNTIRPHRGSTAILPNSVEEEIYDFVCR